MSAIDVPATTETARRGVREAPAVSPDGGGQLRPGAEFLEVLDVHDIQGNIIAGFNKDFQSLVFLRIDDVPLFKAWLRDFADLVATAEEVLEFNRLFKRMRRRRGYSGSVKASWINIAFTYVGLRKLTDDADAFTDASFRSGVVAQSAKLLDPTAEDAEGHPNQWLVRDGEGGVEVVILVAADTLADLEAEVARVEQMIYAPRRNGRPVGSGASMVFKQEGRTQPGALRGHEHFGFLDGVSQPGLRGRSSANGELLTPRQNPDDPDQGKPGQDLIWPGEFVFGYHGQDPGEDVATPGWNSLRDRNGRPVAPDWAKNGSYLVFRRLRQDVFKFHTFLNTESAKVGLTPAALGARLVGRWASGAPIMRAPNADNTQLADDECANNDFEFLTGAHPTRNPPGNGQCSDTYPASPGDPEGDVCPFAAHIRKSYPRDDVAKDAATNWDVAARRLDESDTQTHRLLRRGVPFGPPSRSTAEAPIEDGTDRGLLFIAYMTSIVDQFEFVTKSWVNSPSFKEPNAGVDPIIGQAQGAGGSRRRKFNVRVSGQDHELVASDEWVIPTGGGYFFSPPISALSGVLAEARG